MADQVELDQRHRDLEDVRRELLTIGVRIAWLEVHEQELKQLRKQRADAVKRESNLNRTIG